jgi:hypothetical protein
LRRVQEWLSRIAAAPKIGRDQFKLAPKALHHGPPDQSELRPTMKEEKRPSLAKTGDIEMQVTDANTVLLNSDGFCSGKSFDQR